MTNKYLEFCESLQAADPELIAADFKRKIAEKWGIGLARAEYIYKVDVLAHGFAPFRNGKGKSESKKNADRERLHIVLAEAEQLKFMLPDLERKGIAPPNRDRFCAMLTKILLKKRGLNYTSSTVSSLLSGNKFKYKRK